jgi:hypothetical protein
MLNISYCDANKSVICLPNPITVSVPLSLITDMREDIILAMSTVVS